MCRNTSFGEKYSPLHQNDKHREIIQGLSLPGDGSLEALAAHVEMAAPADLTDFLSGFQYTAPALVGDMAAVERIAVEFCEDAAYNGVLYVESRFCPNFLVGESGSVTSDDVVEAVLRGFKKGEEEFGVVARVILCCIRFIVVLSQLLLYGHKTDYNVWLNDALVDVFVLTGVCPSSARTF